LSGRQVVERPGRRAQRPLAQKPFGVDAVPRPVDPPPRGRVPGRRGAIPDDPPPTPDGPGEQKEAEGDRLARERKSSPRPPSRRWSRPTSRRGCGPAHRRRTGQRRACPCTSRRRRGGVPVPTRATFIRASPACGPGRGKARTQSHVRRSPRRAGYRESSRSAFEPSRCRERSRGTSTMRPAVHSTFDPSP